MIILVIFIGSSFDRGEGIGQKWNDGLGQNIYWLASHKIIALLINPTTLFLPHWNDKFSKRCLVILTNQMRELMLNSLVALAREQEVFSEYKRQCNFKSWKPERCCKWKDWTKFVSRLQIASRIIKTMPVHTWYLSQAPQNFLGLLSRFSDLRTFVWRKMKPRNVSVEMKWKISCVCQY